jgi:hypothetical protein
VPAIIYKKSFIRHKYKKKMETAKKLIAICFDENNKAYKYKYKLLENSKSLQSFERFCTGKKYKYINYYYKESGAFLKRRYL